MPPLTRSKRLPHPPPQNLPPLPPIPPPPPPRIEANDKHTQQLSQNEWDSRRVGLTADGLSDSDVADILCILHPSTPAACQIVADTANSNPQHVFRGPSAISSEYRSMSEEEMETFITFPPDAEVAQGLALRFSSSVINPALGFVFGRNSARSDIVLDTEVELLRISGVHFRIFVNVDGVLMIEDLSANGTVLDNVTLGGRRRDMRNYSKTHMLSKGAVISVLSDEPKDLIKFVVTVPNIEGHKTEYMVNWHAYISHVAVAEKRHAAADDVGTIPDEAKRNMLAAPLTGPPNPRTIPTPPGLSSDFGMHWDGGEKYKCVGVLGKGAFAIVYQLSTVSEGRLYAAKELEKRRFMKNGMLDTKLNNEMKIMQTLQHKNIVRYHDFVETKEHLYIIMEYIKYGDLAGHIYHRGSLPEANARIMSAEILDALRYLHDQGVTHRDIKPDNILIAEEHPFSVKLTDFGLSKVAKDDATFLRTFCGTLLYCAPEVFPQYDKYFSRGTKRPRQSTRNARSYGQTVDIWSYAAVLYYSLCNQPPFEGLVDANGQAMLDQIMKTKVDFSPLWQRHISGECIELLQAMLNTDPMQRPTEVECLKFSWLAGIVGQVESQRPVGLNQILEEDEELDASKIVLDDRPIARGACLKTHSQPSSDSDSDAPVKRQKGESFVANQYEAESGQSEFEWGSIPIMNDVHSSAEMGVTSQAPGRMYNEIDAAAKSSGLFVSMGLMRDGSSDAPDTMYSGPDQPNGSTSVKYPSLHDMESPPTSPAYSQFTQHPASAPSLLGAESMVRDLHMSTPPERAHDAASEQTTPRAPTTPFGEGQVHNGADETTPKAPESKKFERGLNIKPVPSQYWDPLDPSTHTIEYARSKSGYNFADGDTILLPDSGVVSLPDTVVSSFQSEENWQDKENISLAPSASAPIIPEFKKPQPILGRLVTTHDSFAQITINIISTSLTATGPLTWGRNRSCTKVYLDGADTRVPKCGLELFFTGDGLDDARKSGAEWTNLTTLEVHVGTQSSKGITVNHMHLRELAPNGRKQYGLLHSDDEICITNGLKFVCEFFAGRSKARRRPEQKAFEVLTHESAAANAALGREAGQGLLPAQAGAVKGEVAAGSLAVQGQQLSQTV